MYYERLLSSQDQAPVIKKAIEIKNSEVQAIVTGDGNNIYINQKQKIDRNELISELVNFHKQHDDIKNILQMHALHAYKNKFYKELSDNELIGLVAFKRTLEPLYVKYESIAIDHSITLERKFALKREIEQIKKHPIKSFIKHIFKRGTS